MAEVSNQQSRFLEAVEQHERDYSQSMIGTSQTSVDMIGNIERQRQVKKQLIKDIE